MHVTVRLDRLTNPLAIELVARLNHEIQARYSDPLDDSLFSLDRDEVAAGCGAFALAWVGGQAVGCGAVRLIDETTAELKRMFVAPEHRRQGVAAAVLRFLEDQALVLGAARVVLETVESPPAAVALYRSAGYKEILRFGPYVDSEISYCMGRNLSRN